MSPMIQVDVEITHPDGTIESYADFVSSTYTLDLYGALGFGICATPLAYVKSEIARLWAWRGANAR